MTNFIEPMMAAALSEKKRPDITYENGYLLEAKHDGMRAIITKFDSVVEIYSRVGKVYAEHVPSLVAQFVNVPNGTILDGELMVSRETVFIEGNAVPKPDFNMTMRIMGSNPDKAIARQDEETVRFYAFDLLQCDGNSLIGETYEVRSAILRDLVDHHTSIGRFTTIDGPPEWGPWDESTLEALLREGVEGAILKNKDSVYLPGKRRANTWYKVKAELTADVVVYDFTEAKEGVTGKFLGQIGAIKFGAYDDEGEFHEIGQCSGMTDEVRQYWTDIRDNADITQRVIEIKYNDLIGDGTPRHPQYRTERFDKLPEDCLMSQFTV